MVPKWIREKQRRVYVHHQTSKEIKYLKKTCFVKYGKINNISVTNEENAIKTIEF